jgi:probable addiction module antidote protein
MSGKPVKMTPGPHSSRAEIAAYINHALVVPDITGICQAIGDTTRLHDMSDIAQKSGIERPSIYRAFSGKRYPNFTTTNLIAQPEKLLKPAVSDYIDRIVDRRGLR